MSLPALTAAQVLDEVTVRPPHLAVVEAVITETVRRRILADDPRTARDLDAVLTGQRAVLFALASQRYHVGEDLRGRAVVLDEWTDGVLDAGLPRREADRLAQQQNGLNAAEHDEEMRARLADDHGLRAPYWPDAGELTAH